MNNIASTSHTNTKQEIAQTLNRDLQRINSHAVVSYQSDANQFKYVGTYGETFTTESEIDIREAVYSDICRLLQISSNVTLQASGVERSVKVEHNLADNLFYINGLGYAGIEAVQAKVASILALYLVGRVDNSKVSKRAEQIA